MKHYLVLAIALATPAYAQPAPATNVQAENAAQSIQLPPTATQEAQANVNQAVTTAPAVSKTEEVPPLAAPVAKSEVVAPVANIAPTAIVVDPIAPVVPPVAAGPAANGIASPVANIAPAAPAQPVAPAAVVAPVASVALPVASTSESPNLLEHAVIAFGAVLGLGFFGLTLVRLKKKGALGFGKNERAQMEIVSQFSLGPKRKIIIVRIRDQEIALASTEHGVTMITELALPKQTRTVASALEPKLVNSARAETSSREQSESAQAKKSESFLNALKNIKTKAASQQNENRESVAQNSSQTTAPAKATPTLGQTRAAFPKYLASAFQQEGNRKVKSAGGNSDELGEDENLENVTNMIRQKLKNIHQAG